MEVKIYGGKTMLEWMCLLDEFCYMVDYGEYSDEELEEISSYKEVFSPSLLKNQLYIMKLDVASEVKYKNGINEITTYEGHKIKVI